MIVQAYPFGTLSELPLFRPFDKATIWEQRDVLCVAGEVRPEVMLWECMALNPRYVEILQRSWMKDDIATITNAYPDHEDIQGPAGIDVAETISRFIPDKSHLVTSEELMLPLLREQAAQRKTSIETIGWLEAGLLTDDILERFPYSEHPFNIALVARMARYLGIDETFAIKEMADRVIPDLGVLKTFPESSMRGRRIIFTNAMSANERYGCLNSWQRMGFSEHHPTTHPAEWITTIVNNRSDRLPRSRVFARMLVRDLRADRHVLIGSNLTGLQGFIAEELEEYIDQHIPSQETENWISSAKEVLVTLSHEFFVPTTRSVIGQQLYSALVALGAAAIDATLDLTEEKHLISALESANQSHYGEDLINYLTAELSLLSDFEQLSEQLEAAEQCDISVLTESLRTFFTRAFNNKIVVIENYHASGEEILARLADLTPPGFLNRNVGVQNIKGTGLDYVYRWLAWDECDTLCNQIQQERKELVRQGLLGLAAIQNYGQLALEKIRTAVDSARNSKFIQEKELQLALDKIEAQWSESLTNYSEMNYSSDHAATTWHTRLKNIITSAFHDSADVFKSIERRFRAQKIYKALCSQRISRTRAREELWQLYHEQH